MIDECVDEIRLGKNESGKWIFELTFREDQERITSTGEKNTPYLALRAALKSMKKYYKNKTLEI